MRNEAKGVAPRRRAESLKSGIATSTPANHTPIPNPVPLGEPSLREPTRQQLRKRLRTRPRRHNELRLHLMLSGAALQGMHGIWPFLGLAKSVLRFMSRYVLPNRPGGHLCWDVQSLLGWQGDAN
jgi:hypothetical protein